MVCMNPQSMERDIKELEKGGYFIYDSTKPMDPELVRDDIDIVGLPLMEKCREMYKDARQQQLFRNIMYVGSLAALFGSALILVRRAMRLWPYDRSFLRLLVEKYNGGL